MERYSAKLRKEISNSFIVLYILSVAYIPSIFIYSYFGLITGNILKGEKAIKAMRIGRPIFYFFFILFFVIIFQIRKYFLSEKRLSRFKGIKLGYLITLIVNFLVPTSGGWLAILGFLYSVIRWNKFREEFNDYDLKVLFIFQNYFCATISTLPIVAFLGLISMLFFFIGSSIYEFIILIIILLAYIVYFFPLPKKFNFIRDGILKDRNFLVGKYERKN